MPKPPEALSSGLYSVQLRDGLYQDITHHFGYLASVYYMVGNQWVESLWKVLRSDTIRTEQSHYTHSKPNEKGRYPVIRCTPIESCLLFNTKKSQLEIYNCCIPV